MMIKSKYKFGLHPIPALIICLGILQFVTYLWLPIRSVNVSLFLLYLTLFILLLFLLFLTYLIYTWPEKGFTLFSISIIFYIWVLVYILVDYTNSFVFDESASYWFFSSLFQGLAAMLGIIVGLITLKKKDKQKEFREFYPAILFIGISIVLSVMLLPFTRFIVKYQPLLSAFTSSIILLVLFSVSMLLWSLYNSLYASSRKV